MTAQEHPHSSDANNQNARQDVAELDEEHRKRKQQLEEKPLLRGWIHLVTFPLSIAASVVLICLAPGGAMKAAVSIYGATVMLLFGVSAALHIGHGHVPTKLDSILEKIDYSNIFLVIAGTNTPFLFAITNVTVRRVYLTVIWATAIIGTVVHLIFPNGLDWLFTIVYCVLGLAPFTILHLFWISPYIGPVPTILLICGGGAYILGSIPFAIRKPNIWPGVFGYHELFHLGTVAGYTCHVIAIFMTVCAMR